MDAFLPRLKHGSWYRCMADQQPDRLLESSTPSAAKAKSDAPLRLVTADDAVVVPVDAQSSDDTPTIISKQQPLLAQTQGAPVDFLTHDLRGKKLAHFELIEAIGVGGMAAVLRARDTQLDRFVALKILPPEMANDPDNVQRFHQEARAAAKLDHENIARVFFCGEEQNLHFIAFEYVEGENLKSVLEKRGRLPVPEAVRYVLQIATGLEHAASRGVVHRDIKPSNIIISPNGRAKLVDMGLARSREVHKDKGLTQSGVTLGTFDYISPEQALEPRDADCRSDIYSLGCTFYHMLTGQAPVPDGTAARKLHHHQHVAPLDPRQLNAEVPDEVALILARMMAKDPRSRYQRPVHLVQHLLQVAQKVGAAAEVPEGLLFVDAPLPAPPGQRPLLFVSLAVLLLGVVLAILSLAPPVQGPGNTPKGLLPIAKSPGPKDSNLAGKGPQPVPPAGKLTARKEDQLREILSKTPTEAFISGIISVNGLGLFVKVDNGKTLTLDAVNDRYAAGVTHKVDVENGESAILNLEVDGTLVVKNLTFELEASTTQEKIFAALSIRGTGTVHFEKCVFVQKVPLEVRLLSMLEDFRKAPLEAKYPVTSVLIDNGEGSVQQRPKVHFQECVFKGVGPTKGPVPGGQVAVGVNGPAEVTVTDCAFRPHFALFHIRGEPGAEDLKDKNEAVAVKVQRSTAFVVYGPAFCIDDEARCRIDVEATIFACPERDFHFDQPRLLHQTYATEPIIAYHGKDNYYQGLNSLWVYPKTGEAGDHIVFAMDEFRSKGAKDAGSVFVKSPSPFKSAFPLAESLDQNAFALNPDLREIRLANESTKGIGLTRCTWGEIAKLPPLSTSTAVADFKPGKGEKVVDPDYEGNEKAYHKTVQAAVLTAEPGDVIYIKPGKKDRELIKVDPIRLPKATVDFTLKPWPGARPRLMLDDFDEPDVAMFRITDGEMHLEELEFVVEPHKEGYKAQAVVQITGNARCTFKKCKVTLKPRELDKGARPVELSMVTLPDLDEAMKMASTPPRSAPEILLNDCFVRGDGDLLTVRASRPAYVEITNTLIALDGSLVTVQGAAKEPMADTNGKLRLHLDKTSAYLTDPLLWLKGNKSAGKGLLPLHVESVRESLFVSLGEQPAPLVLFEATEYDEAAVRKLFMWRGDDNAYLNHKLFLEHRRFDVSFSFGWDQTRWLDFTRETRSKTMTSSIVLSKPLWDSPAETFSPMDRFGHRNVDVAPKTRPDR